VLGALHVPQLATDVLAEGSGEIDNLIVGIRLVSTALKAVVDARLACRPLEDALIVDDGERLAEAFGAG
jgi:hypothetical protein